MKAVVVASGELVADDAGHLDDADLVIAADGGATSLDRLGRRPDVVVGDFDSIDPGLAERLRATGVRLEPHPPDKDASDTELALHTALAAGATEVVVVGAFGGPRLDHELANVMLLADPALAGRDVRLARGRTVARTVRDGGRLELGGSVGALVTLLPVGADAVGVTTVGLRWPLDSATLAVGASRGLSNEIVREPASVQVEGGIVLVIEVPAERSTT